MSSSELLDLLEVLQPLVYGGLGVVAFVQWRRRPGTASAWLATTFGVLGVVIVAAQLLPETSDDPAVEWGRKAMVAVLVLFPYCLYRFMTSLIRPIRWVWITAPILTIAVGLAALVLPDFPESGEPRPTWFQVYITALLIQWVFLTGVVAVRLWRAGRGQPIVARRRMRTMSAGAMGLAMALVIAGEAAAESPGAAALVQLLAVAAAPLMLVGFAPPYILRALWRRHEESALKDAELSLMTATTDEEVAHTLLPHARALVGARATLLENAHGEIVASDGLDEEDARAAVESLTEAGIAPDRSVNGSLIRIPMSSGRLTIIASPLTPFFGHDELTRLEGLAAFADLAIARAGLLDNQRRFASIVESTDDAIYSKTLDGVIESWNPGAEAMYGYRPEEVLGKPISMLVPPDIENDVPAILERVRRGERVEHYETKRRAKDGRTIDVSLTVSPIRDADGKVEGASTIARDVSEHRKMEMEREAIREEAERANRAKNEFLSRMSHELRTPLNAVLGFAQLLDMDPLTPEQKEGTTEIMKAGKHLLELIDEVLDISRIEAGKLRLSLEPVDVVQAVEECMSLLTPLADEEGVRLRVERPGGFDGPVYVTADRQRLKQVLLNLISNGIKYNRQHGDLSVSFETTNDGRRLRVDVTDTGHGIPAERMDRLFAPFERLGAEGSGVEGIGLGLALSKPLVEAMGGTIAVASELGQGTTFSVELASADGSAIPEESFPREEAAAPAATAPSRTILYIEDNLSNLKLVERLVARRPTITLISAMQGGLGVTLARDHRPDLILLDLNLPDLPGEEVLARLHSDPRTADLPVVVISADATSGQVRRLREAGARDYLTKPIDVKRFFSVVDTFCTEP
jgi:PAS domain S-box-containing protein